MSRKESYETHIRGRRKAPKYRLANFVMSYLIQTDHKTRLMDGYFPKISREGQGGGYIRTYI